MAQNTRKTVSAGAAWTRLTDANATGDISIMLASNRPVWLQATSGSTPPSSSTNGPLALINFGDGWSEATIEEKFPGISSADNLWARPLSADIGLGSKDAIIGISHAT